MLATYGSFAGLDSRLSHSPAQFQSYDITYSPGLVTGKQIRHTSLFSYASWHYLTFVCKIYPFLHGYSYATPRQDTSHCMVAKPHNNSVCLKVASVISFRIRPLRVAAVIRLLRDRAPLIGAYFSYQDFYLAGSWAPVFVGFYQPPVCLLDITAPSMVSVAPLMLTDTRLPTL